MSMRRAWMAALVAAGIGFSGPALAACGNGSDFSSWLAGFKQRAAAAGVSSRAIESGLAEAGYDESVIRRDRAQAVFAQSFLEFSGRMVNNYRLKQGRSALQQNASLFNRIESTYGVPGAVLVGFWGLETDFGQNLGDSSTIRSLSTLAYDCRRPEKFEPELIAALQIIDRGDLTAQQMRGPWAGELGQLQFLPRHYLTYGTDADGDGHVNLLRSVPDVMTSGAKMLRDHGWRPNEPWLQEVSVPAEMRWEQADLAIKQPRSVWVAAGVRAAQGSLPSDNMPAALLLPMGRKGPAFLAYPNFDIYIEWNQSLVYATTAAYFATRLDGAPAVTPGSAQAFSFDQTVALQRALQARGYDVGKADGNIGAKTRAAIKDVQLKAGLPADSYPSAEVMQAVR